MSKPQGHATARERTGPVAGSVESTINPAPPVLAPATLLRRFGALLADWILVSLIAGFVGPPQQHPWAPPVILLVEYGFFVGLFGQTPGMFVTRIRCARLVAPGCAASGPVGVPRALLRAALLILVVPALVMDADRRGLHDRAAGTVMIR